MMGKISEILRSGAGDALIWYCPGCKMSHQINIGQGPGPRWTWNGNAEKPTFSPSVLVNYSQTLTEEQWAFIESGGEIKPIKQVCHSFVVDGAMQFLADCTHDMAGQTVPIPPFHPDDE